MSVQVIPLTEAQIKEIAIKFFYDWYNSPGTNTAQGFEKWWHTNKDTYTPKQTPAETPEYRRCANCGSACFGITGSVCHRCASTLNPLKR